MISLYWRNQGKTPAPLTLPRVPTDPYELREHPCGRCGCVLRTLAKHPATHTCHDQQTFIKRGRA